MKATTATAPRLSVSVRVSVIASLRHSRRVRPSRGASGIPEKVRANSAVKPPGLFDRGCGSTGWTKSSSTRGENPSEQSSPRAGLGRGSGPRQPNAGLPPARPGHFSKIVGIFQSLHEFRAILHGASGTELSFGRLRGFESKASADIAAAAARRSA